MGGESSTVTTLRIITVVLGLIVLALGAVSHYDSKWVKERTVAGTKVKGTAPYDTCEVQKVTFLKNDARCPDIEWEEAFIYVIIACFLASVVIVVVSRFINIAGNPFKLIDMIYHILGAVLLLVSGSVYIYSAVLINNIYGNAEEFLSKIKVQETESFLEGGFRYKEKLAAGGLAIIQAILYGVLAFMVH